MKKTLDALTMKIGSISPEESGRNRKPQKFEIQSVERNWAGIQNHMKIGSIGPEKSRRNQGNLILLKENSIFLLHILIDQRKGSIG